ncbi:MAG: YbaB/EbfC family nucleoid-associated protein [Clostridiales bacterium]|nr:YbaB/EbfC family nucleoid-associated protein [Clostridiales bacterium]
MGRGMRAGKKPKQNKASMQKQMQQMQAVQKQMEEMQAKIDQQEVTTTAGGGAVSATINGKKEIVSLEIKPEVVDPDDVEMLQDLIIAAVNEGIRQIEEISSNEMSKLTSGLGLPF